MASSFGDSAAVVGLPPHAWDDDAHRTAIHTAFDVWFIFHEQGDRPHARSWRRQLKRLIRLAGLRRDSHERRMDAVSAVITRAV